MVEHVRAQTYVWVHVKLHEKDTDVKRRALTRVNDDSGCLRRNINEAAAVKAARELFYFQSASYVQKISFVTSLFNNECIHISFFSTSYTVCMVYIVGNNLTNRENSIVRSLFFFIFVVFNSQFHSICRTTTNNNNHKTSYSHRR